jgi:hypothetical protein
MFTGRKSEHKLKLPGFEVTLNLHESICNCYKKIPAFLQFLLFSSSFLELYNIVLMNGSMMPFIYGI